MNILTVNILIRSLNQIDSVRDIATTAILKTLFRERYLKFQM